MRRIQLISLMLVMVLLVGCFSPKISLRIIPDKIELSQENMKVDDITLEFTLSGFSADYRLNKVLVQIYNQANPDDILFQEEQKPPVDSIPILPGIKTKESLGAFDFRAEIEEKIIAELAEEYGDIADIPAEEYDEEYAKAYDRILKGQVYVLEITIEGTKTSTAKATITFK